MLKSLCIIKEWKKPESCSEQNKISDQDRYAPLRFSKDYRKTAFHTY
jgi:hypothetical protein